MAASPQSIRSLLPLDLSGRYSRQGFVYQDHVGVYLCLCMALDESISEIWFETQDDITLLINQDGLELVEFVQVKHDDYSSGIDPLIQQADPLVMGIGSAKQRTMA